MASLTEIYIKKEALETLLKACNQREQKGIGITISISNEQNKYGKNATAYVSQTKEQREAKKERYYIGNGSVVWADGIIKKVGKAEKTETDYNNNEMPF